MTFPTPWLYRHYKWPTYEVLWIVRHTDTDEDLVLYRGTWEYADMWRTDPYFVRSLTEREKPAQDTDGHEVMRYTLSSE